MAEDEKKRSTESDKLPSVTGLSPAEKLTFSAPPPEIEGYEVLGKVGEAGQGQIWRARQLGTQQEVALKVPKVGLLSSKKALARFEREVELTASLKHPNIARIHDSGIHQSIYYYTMDLIEGKNLDEYVEQNNLTHHQILGLMRTICQAVQHAHQNGVIHRDLKPSNVIVTQDGQPYIVDFGLAKSFVEDDLSITVSTDGEAAGTPAYMSPEQAAGHIDKLDTRTDVYSLGAILFTLLIREYPHDLSGSRFEVLQRIAQEQVRQPRKINPKIDKDLEALLLKALEIDPDRRYSSAGELARDIDNYLSGAALIAGPQSQVYQLKKFVRRHQSLVTGVGAVAVALIIGLIISTAMYFRARRALDAMAKLERQVQADRNLSTAQRLHAEGRYQAALTEIEANLENQSVGPKAHLLHARLLFEVGRFNDAVTVLDRLLTEESEIAGAAHYLLSRIYTGSDTAKAKEHQQKAESLLPPTAEAYCLRAMAASTPKQTIQWLSKAVELDPSQYPSRKARALAYYAIREYERMAHEVEAIIAIRPKDPLGYALRAIARRETRQFEDAIKDHDHAIRLCNVQTELAELYNQRRETHIRIGNITAALQDSQRCVEIQPNEFIYNFHVFTALVSLKDFEGARQEYRKIVQNEPTQQQQFQERARWHVFNILGREQQFELTEDVADDEPFSSMQEAIEYYHTLQAKATRLVTGAHGLATWSPDGKRVAYGRSDIYAWQAKKIAAAAPTISGPSGVEIVDLESGAAHLLVSPGRAPAWSPDGEHIAFVRSPKRSGSGQEEEIWFIPIAGGEPRRLALGGWPSWASDSKRVFFHSRVDDTLCSIRIDDPAATPTRITLCPGWYPAVSPDEKHVAFALGTELRIKELSSDSVVTKWNSPGLAVGMIVSWSPNGRELSMAGYKGSDWGLWIFDIESKKAWHILDAPAWICRWSLDGTKAAIMIGYPFEEIWVAELDPAVPTYQTLGPAQSPQEYLQHRLAATSRAIEAAPHEADNYLSRAIVHVGLGEYEDAAEDIENCTALVESGHLPTLATLQRWTQICTSLQIRSEFESLYLHTLKLSRQVLGEEDQTTRHLTHNLAMLYLEQARYTEAEVFLTTLLDIQSRDFGTEDTRTLRTMRYLEVVCFNLGRYDDAERWGSRLLESRTRLQGKEHPDTFIAMSDVATVYSRQGRYGEAEKLLLEVLEGRKRTLGEQHLSTLQVMSSLARLYGSRIGHYAEAQQLITDALEIARRVLGDRHPLALSLLNDKAWFLATFPIATYRDGQEALKLATEYCELTDWKEGFYFDTLAAAYAESGDFESAIKWQIKAIDSLTDTQQRDHIAEFETRLELYQSSRPYHQKPLKSK